MGSRKPFVITPEVRKRWNLRQRQRRREDAIVRKAWRFGKDFQDFDIYQAIHDRRRGVLRIFTTSPEKKKFPPSLSKLKEEWYPLVVVETPDTVQQVVSQNRKKKPQGGGSSQPDPAQAGQQVSRDHAWEQSETDESSDSADSSDDDSDSDGESGLADAAQLQTPPSRDDHDRAGLLPDAPIYPAPAQAAATRTANDPACYFEDSSSDSESGSPGDWRECLMDAAPLSPQPAPSVFRHDAGPFPTPGSTRSGTGFNPAARDPRASPPSGTGSPIYDMRQLLPKSDNRTRNRGTTGTAPGQNTRAQARKQQRGDGHGTPKNQGSL